MTVEFEAKLQTDPIKKRVGDRLDLSVKVKKPEGVKFSWWRGDTPLEERGDTLRLTDLAEGESGIYKVFAWEGESEPALTEMTEGGQVEVVVSKDEKASPNAQGEPSDKPGEWDPAFADTAIGFASALGVVLLLWVTILAALVLNRDPKLPALTPVGLAWMAMLGLLGATVALIAGGVAVALIDLRGRARAVREISETAGSRGFNLGKETGEAISKIISSWGTLGLASALLLLAAVAMIGVTALGWRSLPDPSTPKPSPSPSVSQSPEPSADPSAPTGDPSPGDSSTGDEATEGPSPLASPTGE
ncbi:MAG TPA: hypothetical protein PKE40_08770 [Arachnia sp.]|nr:hypothetical protein [Arachnia sp.]HMT86430.1 hypothetical protein [Arachnia sp.]